MHSISIILVDDEGCDGDAVDVEGVRAEDEADLLQVEGVQLVVVQPLHVHDRHLENNKHLRGYS